MKINFKKLTASLIYIFFHIIPELPKSKATKIGRIPEMVTTLDYQLQSIFRTTYLCFFLLFICLPTLLCEFLKFILSFFKTS